MLFPLFDIRSNLNHYDKCSLEIYPYTHISHFPSFGITYYLGCSEIYVIWTSLRFSQTSFYTSHTPRYVYWYLVNLVERITNKTSKRKNKTLYRSNRTKRRYICRSSSDNLRTLYGRASESSNKKSIIVSGKSFPVYSPVVQRSVHRSPKPRTSVRFWAGLPETYKNTLS